MNPYSVVYRVGLWLVFDPDGELVCMAANEPAAIEVADALRDHSNYRRDMEDAIDSGYDRLARGWIGTASRSTTADVPSTSVDNEC